MNLERWREFIRDRRHRAKGPMAPEVHLREAIGWIYRAQDAGVDRGVSHSYVLGKGWMPSYPETTGYIIPTLLNWSQASGDPEPSFRAREMADWEISVQREDGAIPSLATGEPVVFDTGQVVFGWLAAYQDTGELRFRDAAIRGSDWLLSVMDEDAVWRRHIGAGTEPVVYNVRAAWALVEASRVLGVAAYADLARKFLDWSLTQETHPGWFARNCLNQFDRPLLHTICYTAQGQFESGVLLRRPDLVHAAIRTADSIAGSVGSDGRLAGRYDRSWAPQSSWACLTGVAQAIVLWRRIRWVTGDPKYDSVLRSVERFLLSVHDVTSRSGALRGGVRGSFPVDGDYCPWRLPNWATKFMIDALLLASKDVRYPG